MASSCGCGMGAVRRKSRRKASKRSRKVACTYRVTGPQGERGSKGPTSNHASPAKALAAARAQSKATGHGTWVMRVCGKATKNTHLCRTIGGKTSCASLRK